MQQHVTSNRYTSVTTVLVCCLSNHHELRSNFLDSLCYLLFTVYTCELFKENINVNNIQFSCALVVLIGVFIELIKLYLYDTSCVLFFTRYLYSPKKVVCFYIFNGFI